MIKYLSALINSRGKSEQASKEREDQDPDLNYIADVGNHGDLLEVLEQSRNCATWLELKS